MWLFNYWRKRRKPKKEGWYQCTVRHGNGLYSPAVMDLYFWFKPDVGGVWLDKRRKQVFDGYQVYKSSRATTPDNRVWEDCLCERDDIIAWKYLPKAKVCRKKRGL